MEATARVLFAKISSFIRKRIPPKLYRSRTHITSADIANERASFHPSIRTSMSEIVAATKNFSADLIVGRGRSGFIYKAELPSGLKLAVKKLGSCTFYVFREFKSELEILGKLRHRNITGILGYYISGANMILIYKLYEKGNLEVHLHNDSSLLSAGKNDMSYRPSPLSWEARHKIVTGVAKGLGYMHDLDKPIIHRDVKASNVLLDSELEAKLSEFGLARTIESGGSHVSTLPADMDGYMPLEYESGLLKVTVKGDVYSFGVLMLEVATGKRPDSPVVLGGESMMSFVEWARFMVAQNREREMLDPNIWVGASMRGLEETNIKEYFRIATMCVDVIPRKRPAMRDVVESLTKNFI
ncbi:Mitogen-activated protein kinase kinase kinase [Parasponia andersonii]|uniref:non-specific serine/threonine protein kinase n=1 Tax=Parasponia andersonii TaxID=3476 RepID=A0A2P5BV47_PARAD|nr:Mitogen-activated protein kinase kinase kinase [Parasponia andersonii]